MSLRLVPDPDPARAPERPRARSIVHEEPDFVIFAEDVDLGAALVERYGRQVFLNALLDGVRDERRMRIVDALLARIEERSA